ncbi:hypothetical protein OEZ86_007448 [Tetradesmus obliquus]|nr:hypothetical protein OEZ86_007448 [Tetradesmus obliquus]
MASAEVVAAAVTVKLLRDASPVTQTAVWGLAGMLKRNVVETASLCWQLLLQLSQVYMQQQQQSAAVQGRGTAVAAKKLH